MERPVYLALGSNLGEREAALRQAVRLLDFRFGRPCTALSSFIETPAEGFDGPPFINGAVRYDLDLEPLEILRICKEVERELGRTDEGRKFDGLGRRIYRSRPLDIDILLIGDERIDSPELTVPHPRMKEREFVMVPLREIFEGNLLNL